MNTKGISELSVHVGREGRGPALELAVERGYGVEITDFHAPSVLDDSSERSRLIDWYRARLPRVRGRRGLHGAFLDLLPSAEDPRIRVVTRERVEQCLDVAEELALDYAVFHSDFRPMIRHPEFPSRWAESQGKFWRDVVNGRKPLVALENMWEPTPELMLQAVGEIDSPRLGVCLDTGHAHLHGEVPVAEWVSVLQRHVRCVHLSDNARNWDQHLPPGQGSVNWEAVFSALELVVPAVPAVLEVAGGLEAVCASAEYVCRLQSGPPA